MKVHDTRINYVSNPKTAFTGTISVEITPSRYIKGLIKNFETSPGVIVVMLIYIERLLGKMELQYRQVGGLGSILFTSFNAHRIILTSFLVAQKYSEDKNYKLASIARVGGIEKDELIFLENEFVDFMDFNLHIHEEEFNKYVESVILFSRHLCSNSWT
ncbi:unnamed protein product [Moneuplotes crassus]|uniref:Cyclin n=1 Tax=Euplotes crassus TaxID=5936 RepID=A0AAD1XV01_EUPCR|nr:unnamed protein product [Moneuplotes crassus]